MGTGKATSTGDNDLRADIKACIAKNDIQLVPRAFMQYPWVRDFSNNKDKGPKSPYVDSLAYRLDMTITKQVDQHTDAGVAKTVDFDGTDTQAFGLGLFVKLPGPGVSVPLQVRYWYTPTAKIGEKDFSQVEVGDLPYCSNLGICDFESGICNCFSGYTGLRCDTQNAVTYSY